MTRPVGLIAATIGIIAVLSTTAVSTQTAASLGGTVVSAQAPGTPIRRAVVTLSGPGIATNLAAVTDDAGRFEFVGLQPGRYSLFVEKAAYLKTEHGAKRPGRPGTPLMLGAGEHRTGVVLRLTRGAVITGVVRSLTGAPVPGIRVGITHGDRARPLPADLPPLVVTDDEGRYRVFGLMPGSYLVATAPYTSSREAMLMTPPVIDARLAALHRSQLTGSRTTRTESPAPHAVPLVSYPARFFPDTTNPLEAQPVVVSAGEVRDGIDLTIAPAASVSVSGVVRREDGATPEAARLTLKPVGPALTVTRLEGAQESPDAFGAFRFARVPEGQYVIAALMAGGPDRSASEAWWAVADVTVRDTDIEGLTLTLQQPVMLTGRVHLDTTSGSPPLDQFRLRLDSTVPAPSSVPPSRLPNSVGLVRSEATPESDGVVVLKGLLPGTHVPALANAPNGFWLRSALFGGRDLLDDPLTVDGGSISMSGAVFRITDAPTGLSGIIGERDGRPGTDYFVVVIPRERAWWRPGARRIRAVRPGTDGAYIVPGLPGGEYLVAALTDFEADDLGDRAFLEEMSRFAVPVTIRDGERTVQNLQVTSAR